VTSTALVPQDLIAPRGFSLIQSGLYKIRISFRTRWQMLRGEAESQLDLLRSRLHEISGRVRIALDPSISTGVATYRVGQAHALRHGRRALAAPLDAEVGNWVRPIELAAGFLDVEHRRALARHWLSHGQAAHAAIAAYTQLAGELMSLGAHPDLLMHVHACALERVHHAEGAFSIASAFAGFEISPSSWPELPKLARTARRSRQDALSGIAERALLEGWLSTAFGAAVAQLASARASEAAVTSHLRMVAEDSARQAAFGERLLDWTLKLGGEPVALVLALAIRNLPRTALAQAQIAGLRPEVMERNGVPNASAQRALYLSVRSNLVRAVAAKLDGIDAHRAPRE
jgi:hypothetical protein